MHRSTRRDIVWSDDQLDAFYTNAPAHLHLAVTLALWTAQRQGDLLELTWGDYDGSRIRLQQNKTGSRVSIPVASELKLALDAAKKALNLEEDELQSRTILTNSRGQPWGLGFRASWSAALKKACIEGVTFHDLRGTSLTRLGEAGATPFEIAAISGHSIADVHAILQSHYIGLNDRMADAGMKKLEAFTPKRTPNSQLWRRKRGE